jgi:hypothetical protein
MLGSTGTLCLILTQCTRLPKGTTSLNVMTNITSIDYV